jgi:septum formation protein
MTLILASESPRRRELLRQCGIDCEVSPVSIDEEPHAGEEPEQTALRLARGKAGAALRLSSGREGWILAADTVVADGPAVLGKPRDRSQAEEFLLRLRGREHRVITAVCLIRCPGGAEETDIAVTAVRMRNYSAAEIRAYVAGGDAMDKAGAYAIQHPSFRPVESIRGCYTNVVGLPLCRVYALMERGGPRPERPLPDGCRTGTTCGFTPPLDRKQQESAV